MNGRPTREISVGIAILALFLFLGMFAPGYFTAANITDLFLANLPVLIIALGMTLVILTGQIDISVGSMFAVCGIAGGVFAKSGLPMPIAVIATCVLGALLGGINGALVAYVRIPAIVVTLAAMVSLRDGLRWLTDGAWVQNLPPGFQWLGFTQSGYLVMAMSIAATLTIFTALTLGNRAAGRSVYATGSNPEAARLAGIDSSQVTFAVFAITGALTGFAALLNSVRFNQIPSNAGLGLELKVIAAVVVGGTAITGGSGSILGTVLGVILMGAIGPALTFLGVSAYWERAIQGAIILAAVVIDAVRARSERHGVRLAASRA